MLPTWQAPPTQPGQPTIREVTPIWRPKAAEALKKLSVPVRSGVKKALEVHLTHEPTKVSKSRIKKLRGLSQPQYRLRGGQG